MGYQELNETQSLSRIYYDFRSAEPWHSTSANEAPRFPIDGLYPSVSDQIQP
jgi:hypothetical protein